MIYVVGTIYKKDFEFVWLKAVWSGVGTLNYIWIGEMYFINEKYYSSSRYLKSIRSFFFFLLLARYIDIK